MSRVRLVDHEPSWAAAYEKEAAALRECLGRVVACTHHIGSTAIPGIFAKPILDILVEVTDLDAVDAHNHTMAVAGYEAMGEYGIPGRRYFRKHNARGERSHHVHVFAAGTDQVRRHVAFRDLLRADPILAAEYSDLKRRLAREHPDDSRRYTDGKTAFIYGAIMDLGTFSVSLTVNDIAASRAFYEKLGSSRSPGARTRTGSSCRTAKRRSACSRACSTGTS